VGALIPALMCNSRQGVGHTYMGRNVCQPELNGNFSVLEATISSSMLRMQHVESITPRRRGHEW
jgi:hypothetical protein